MDFAAISAAIKSETGKAIKVFGNNGFLLQHRF